MACEGVLTIFELAILVGELGHHNLGSSATLRPHLGKPRGLLRPPALKRHNQMMTVRTRRRATIKGNVKVAAGHRDVATGSARIKGRSELVNRHIIHRKGLAGLRPVRDRMKINNVAVHY